MAKNDIVKMVKSYNPDTKETVSERQIFGGNPPSDLNFNEIKYKWAINLLENLESCTWFTKEIPLGEDRASYENLTKYEREMYDKSFSQITMMDTLQTSNIAENLIPYISAPEVKMCLVRQAYEEALHSKSYAVMADTISPNSDEVFKRYQTDDMLRAKNDKVAAAFNEVSKNRTEENMFLSLFTNQALEGIYFKSAFVSFYALARSGKMFGTAQMIKLIDRDETNHLTLFKNMIRSINKDKPYLINDPEIADKARKILTDAVELEITWSEYITSGRVLGLSKDIMSVYIKFLANNISKSTGLGILYPDVKKDPLTWVKDFGRNEAKSNFFETKVTDYTLGSLDFDDL